MRSEACSPLLTASLPGSPNGGHRQPRIIRRCATINTRVAISCPWLLLSLSRDGVIGQNPWRAVSGVRVMLLQECDWLNLRPILCTSGWLRQCRVYPPNRPSRFQPRRSPARIAHPPPLCMYEGQLCRDFCTTKLLLNHEPAHRPAGFWQLLGHLPKGRALP